MTTSLDRLRAALADRDGALPIADTSENGAGMLAGAELRIVPDLVAMVRNDLEKR